MEFWLPLVTYSLPVAAGAGVGVGVGVGMGVGLGVGVEVGLGLPPRVLRGEMTHPLNNAIESTKIKKERLVFRATSHLCIGFLVDNRIGLLEFLVIQKRPALKCYAGHG
jgi:hypothetical protein